MPFVLESIRVFLQGQPNTTQAKQLLKQLFSLSFGLHILAAFLLSLVMMAFSVSRTNQQLFAQVMLMFSLLALPLGLWLSQGLCKANTRQAYISATLMSGTLLATPVWFLSITFLLVTASLYHIILLILLILYYGLGLRYCGRWGERISQLPGLPRPEKP